jgi:hypothetical protein
MHETGVFFSACFTLNAGSEGRMKLVGQQSYAVLGLIAG